MVAMAVDSDLPKRRYRRVLPPGGKVVQSRPNKFVKLAAYARPMGITADVRASACRARVRFTPHVHMRRVCR
jgi:hypothetical protein